MPKGTNRSFFSYLELTKGFSVIQDQSDECKPSIGGHEPVGIELLGPFKVSWVVHHER